MILTLTLFTAFLAHQQEAQRAAERIQLQMYCTMQYVKAQHREIERVQPISHLTPAEEAGNRKAEIARLLGPR